LDGNSNIKNHLIPAKGRTGGFQEKREQAGGKPPLFPNEANLFQGFDRLETESTHRALVIPLTA
jgi:hypothetical protein